MKKFIDKYKNEILIFLLAFLIYFIVGTILSYYLDTTKYWSVLFDLDTPRVFGDLAIKDFNHYRTAVHPLFVIFFQPLVYLGTKIINNPLIVISLLQSFIGATILLIFYKIINKMEIEKNLKIIFTIIFGMSFWQIIFSAAVETYIYAQLFLILLWFFAFLKIDKPFNFFDYVFLLALGVGSIAVTITNFVQFLIVIFFIILLNKNLKNRFMKLVVILIVVVSVSVTLAEVQNIIWPSAPNFFTKSINDLIYGTSEEKLYISSNISLNSFLNIINSNFSNALNLNKLVFPENGYLVFLNTNITSIISILMFVGYVVINLFFMIKTKFNVSNHKLYYGMLLTYIFNFVLHLFYGNSISYIYICHYNFIIFFLLAYIFKYFNIKINKKYVYFIVPIVIILSLKNVISMFIILSDYYNFITYFRILNFIIVFIITTILLIVFQKKLYLKIIFIILSFLSLYGIRSYLNNTTSKLESSYVEYKEYIDKFELYKRQLKDMKNEYNVNYYSKREEPIGVYYFGMADRRKILYKSGKLIDIKTKEIIKTFAYTDEVIIPNEYAVLLKDKEEKEIVIYENEDGIFYSEDGIVKSIEKGNKKINLPDFEGSKYSEILKVLLQEILFNIDGDVPKPNLITYTGAWYRDTMLATMVLERTENISLLTNWVQEINSIYDYQRSSNLKEADNLGELLYIIGATNVDRDDLVKRILNEIKEIKNDDGTISGIVDGFNQSYYPTVLAIFGAQKNDINLDLSIPTVDDGYAKLTWYFSQKPWFDTNINTKYYPYLDWASFHYSGYGELFMLDEIYPLTYEGGYEAGSKTVEEECFISKYYCEQRVYLSHMWHAAEMFLYLNEK